MPVGFFQALVRPVLVPDTRPRQTQAPLALSDADRVVEIGSGSGNVLRLEHSHSFSWSKGSWSEKSRTFDTTRITNPENGDQHLDAEVVTKLRGKNQFGDIEKRTYQRPQATPTIEILSRNNKRP